MGHKYLQEGNAREGGSRHSSKTSERSAAHRLRSVRRVLAGEPAAAVGRRYGDSPRAVAYWVSRYRDSGAKGLETAPRSGRPSKLAPAQLKMVRAFVAREGAVSGPALANFIKGRFGVVVTRRQCSRILDGLGA